MKGKHLLSPLAKALIARVLGRNTNILALTNYERHDGYKGRHCKTSCCHNLPVWELEVREDVRLYCSEACIIKDLNKEEDNEDRLIASHIRSEIMGECTVGSHRGFFMEGVGWLNTQRFGPDDIDRF